MAEQITADEAGGIDRAQALRVIEALRKGSNCLEGTKAFSVGRTLLYQAASDLLEELEVSEGSAVRWLKARYGEGKTHTLARLMDIAHIRGWVSSYVQISGKGEATELHRFEEVYAAIVRNCLCGELVVDDKGRVEPGRRSGWEWILDRWCEQLQILAVGRSTGDVPSFRLRDSLEQAVTAMRRKWSVHGSFGEALRQFALARADGDVTWSSLLLDWFTGQNVHSRGGNTRRQLKEAGILESLSRRNAKEMLRSLSSFLRYRGFGGMLILFDEVENVLGEPPRARRAAYTVLRELIDNIDDRHGMTTTAFYIAGTPDLYESETGISEYEALAERVLLPSLRKVFNPAGSVVDLGAIPLRKQDFLDIAVRIAQLHGIARRWDLGDGLPERMQMLLNEQLDRSPDTTAWAWVRSVVGELDEMRASRRSAEDSV